MSVTVTVTVSYAAMYTLMHGFLRYGVVIWAGMVGRAGWGLFRARF